MNSLDIGAYLNRPRPVINRVHRDEAQKRRQDALLDAALLETFPASDPISVVRVN